MQLTNIFNLHKLIFLYIYIYVSKVTTYTKRKVVRENVGEAAAHHRRVDYVHKFQQRRFRQKSQIDILLGGGPCHKYYRSKDMFPFQRIRNCNVGDFFSHDELEWMRRNSSLQSLFLTQMAKFNLIYETLPCSKGRFYGMSHCQYGLGQALSIADELVYPFPRQINPCKLFLLIIKPIHVCRCLESVNC